MRIDNFDVYGIAESMVASGLPMMTEYKDWQFKEDCYYLDEAIFAEKNNKGIAIGSYKLNKHYQRLLKLSQNAVGSGHCNALSGIVVQCNVTATNAWWLQMERYHFVQIVSSMSKMHRLRQMLRSGNRECFHGKVAEQGVNALGSENIEDDIEWLVYNCPMGLELTARISTNYLQLKTIYSQRKDHKLKEWRDFCAWIADLPFSELITNVCA